MGHISGPSKRALDGLGNDHDDNPIRRLDPRIRIVAASLFAVVVVALGDFMALGAALSLALLTLLCAQLPLAATWRRVAAMDGFIILMLAMLPFTTPGTAIFSLGPLTATSEGLWKAIAIALKANAIVMVLLAMVGTLSATVLGHALHRLRCPENLVHLLLFTVRYIEVLRQEYQRLRIAMRCRCFRPRNDQHTYRSIGYLLGMLLVRSLERSERILDAMKCRGFNGRFFVVENLRYSKHDLGFSIVFGLTIGLLFLIENWHALSV